MDTTTIRRTTAKRIDNLLEDKIDLLVSLWSVKNNFLDQEQIEEITKVVCQGMDLSGLDSCDQMLPFAKYLDGNFDQEFIEGYDDDPYIYDSISGYLNCSHLGAERTVRGISLVGFSKNTPELVKAIYTTWFNWNGYFSK
jgi:hypothetical protein